MEGWRRFIDADPAPFEILPDDAWTALSGGARTDYHRPDWEQSFWGDNYPRLLEIKHAYDPGNLFRVHHGVGSEATG